MTTDFVNERQVVAVSPEDGALLEKMAAAVREAGNRLLEVYSPEARPASREDIFNAGQRNEEISLEVLRPALAAARPNARWVEEEQETVPLPSGEWWAVDAVEGNVNHVHGLPEWCVSVTLIRDNAPVLAAIYQPIGDLTYTAIKGGGAYLNGQRLRTSTKIDLKMAVVLTGQAEAGQQETYRRIGDSITAMLGRALLVRATVPSTFPLLTVASGHYDAFWQYAPVLPGVAAGVLLTTEAGGIVSDLRGQPWLPGSSDILVASPGLYTAALETPSAIA